MAFSQYQSRDHEVVDYKLFELSGFPYLLRGPAPERLDESISVVGAGQSMGVLCRRPYVDMIRKEYSTHVLNLSVGGASPRLYLNNDVVFDQINKTRCCIIQVLSARSTEVEYFQTRDGKNMMRLRGTSLPYVPGDTAWEGLFRNETGAVVSQVVSGLRQSWVFEMTDLLSRIKVPKVLMWFSKRQPGRPGKLTSYKTASGLYPQFVCADMIQEIKPLADHYVEVASSRGMPNRLTSRFTGEPVDVILGDDRKPRGEDNYYPSPEMHEDAFELLRPALDSVLAGPSQ